MPMLFSLRNYTGDDVPAEHGCIVGIDVEIDQGLKGDVGISGRYACSDHFREPRHRNFSQRCLDQPRFSDLLRACSALAVLLQCSH